MPFASKGGMFDSLHRCQHDFCKIQLMQSILTFGTTVMVRSEVDGNCSVGTYFATAQIFWEYLPFRKSVSFFLFFFFLVTSFVSKVVPCLSEGLPSGRFFNYYCYLLYHPKAELVQMLISRIGDSK